MEQAEEEACSEVPLLEAWLAFLEEEAEEDNLSAASSGLEVAAFGSCLVAGSHPLLHQLLEDQLY